MYNHHNNHNGYHTGAPAPTAKVELSVSICNAKSRDLTSRSDPFCVLFTRNPDQKEWHEHSRTEVLTDATTAEWEKKFILAYHFQQKQDLRFAVYDSDSKKDKLKKHDFLGELYCSLGEIVSAPGNKLTRKLKNSPGNPQLSIRAEEIGSSKEEVTIRLEGHKLDKKDMLGKSDPYMKINKVNPDGSRTLVSRTETKWNTLNPEWKPLVISLTSLCNGDYDRRLCFECYDDDGDGTDGDFIGSFTTTLRKLVGSPVDKNVYELINEKKRAKKKKYNNSGIISLRSIKIDKKHSFMEYLQGGTQMHFTVAVDFTASNGQPNDPTSLHFRSHDGWNQYTTAIRAVGEIIQDYDSDKLFPALGFGAKVPPQHAVSHEFALNFNPDNPYCMGIDGVVNAYYNSLAKVQLWGPTNFAPVIKHVSRFAAGCQDGSNYFVLLIITDGIITDMEETKEAIVRASALPMSLIIVGVGREDFSAMEHLDGDDKKLKSRRGAAGRDIVQFVPLQKFIVGGDWFACQRRLAEAVLAEIPKQVEQYMKSKGFKPKHPHNVAVASPISSHEMNKMNIHGHSEPVQMAKKCSEEESGVTMFPSHQSGGSYPPPVGASGYPPQNSQYPPQNGGSYPPQGIAAYPAPGSAPYPTQGSSPYPSQGSAPYPSPGSAPYPSQGSAPYPSQGNAPYPPQGNAAYPSQSSSPYPPQGNAPYPTQGSTPYPTQGSVPYPPQGSSPYPSTNNPGYQNGSPYGPPAPGMSAPYSSSGGVPPNPSIKSFGSYPMNPFGGSYNSSRFPGPYTQQAGQDAHFYGNSQRPY